MATHELMIEGLPFKEKLLFLTARSWPEHPLGKSFGMPRVHFDFDSALGDPLEKIFSRVVRFDYLKHYLDLGPTAMNAGVIELAKAEKPDFVLWYAVGRRCEMFAETFDELRRLGCCVIVLFTDDDAFDVGHANHYAPHLDYCVSFVSRDAERKYAGFGSRGAFLPSAANPEVYKRRDLPPEYDASFVGTAWPARRKMLNALEAQGVAVSKFGRLWNQFIPIEEVVRIINCSRINLNFTGHPANPQFKQIKGRIFEVCMSGGFLLTEYAEGIEESYEIDREIACFETIQEAREKVSFYLKHGDLRREMARRAYERSQAEHTWSARLSTHMERLLQEWKAGGWARTRGEATRTSLAFETSHAACIFHCKWAAIMLANSPEKGRALEEFDLAHRYSPSPLLRAASGIVRLSPVPLNRACVCGGRVLQRAARVLCTRTATLV